MPSWRGYGQHCPCFTWFGHLTSFLLEIFTSFISMIFEHGLQIFTVHYDISKLLLQWNQLINVGILISLTHFYFHYTLQTDCSRFLCHRPFSMHSNEAPRQPHNSRMYLLILHTTPCHFCQQVLRATICDPNSPWRRQPSTWSSVVTAMNLMFPGPCIFIYSNK
jgi:hypothetical protein